MFKITMIDPPNGGRYGFPKPAHEEYHTLGDDFNLLSWLVDEGYPQAEIDACGDQFHVKTWVIGEIEALKAVQIAIVTEDSDKKRKALALLELLLEVKEYQQIEAQHANRSLWDGQRVR